MKHLFCIKEKGFVTSENTLVLISQEPSTTSRIDQCGSLLTRDVSVTPPVGWLYCVRAKTAETVDTPCSELLKGPNLQQYNDVTEFPDTVEYSCYVPEPGVAAAEVAEKFCRSGNEGHSVTMASCSLCESIAVCIHY